MGKKDLKKVEPARRSFLKKLAAGTAFAAPMLLSFSMQGAKAHEANKGDRDDRDRDDHDRGGSHSASQSTCASQSADGSITLVGCSEDDPDGKTLNIRLDGCGRSVLIQTPDRDGDDRKHGGSCGCRYVYVVTINLVKVQE